MFVLIRYKSNDFSENAYSNSEICVVMLVSLMTISDSVANIILHELSELIIVDK